MSTPVSPRSQGPSSPTRQQLDELDALLQRMLALPVAPGGEADKAVEPPPVAAAPPPPSLPAPPAEEFTVRTLALIHLGASRPETRQPPEPAPPSDGGGSALILAVPALEQRVIEEPEPPAPAPERRPLSGWLRPVLWVNRGFDACAGCLGAPGRWLRRPWGRTLLGLAGLLLLAGVVGWVVLDWMGWPAWLPAIKW
jgi:hypothetical protein